LTTLKTIIVLKRDPTDPAVTKRLSKDEAQALFLHQQYFNPHLLVNNAYKAKIREQFLSELLNRTTVYEVNTTGTPETTQRLIRSLVGIPG